MDIYDPQTIGIMVFGGFMVISAVGIALVSTFSMKETSYEEALAKQRRELGKIQSGRTEKKKKVKTADKKNRGKKKEEKPNGMIPEAEKSNETSEADQVPEPLSAPIVATAPVAQYASEAKAHATPAPADPQPKAVKTSPTPAASSPVPLPKDKKKKKSAKVDPTSITPALAVAPAQDRPSPVPASAKATESLKAKTAPLSAPSKVVPTTSVPAKASSASPSSKSNSKSVPPSAKSAPASNKSAPASTKSTPALTKSTPASDNSAPASTKSAPASTKSAPASTKSAPASDNSSPPSAKSAKASAKSATASSAPASDNSSPPSAKSAKASAKSAPASAKSAPGSAKSAPASAKSAPASDNSSPPSAKSAKASAKSAPASAKSAPASDNSSPPSAKSAKASDNSSPPSAKSAKASAKSAPASAKSAPASDNSSPPSAKSAKSAPASAKSAPASDNSPPASAKSAPASAKSAKSAPAPAKSAPAPAKSAPAPEKSPPASEKSTPAKTKSAPATDRSAPASTKAAPASTKAAPASTKAAPASTKAAPAATKATPASTKAAPASTKAASAVSRSAAAPAKSSAAPTKSAPLLEAVIKDVPVMAVPPVGSSVPKAQEPKKKASKKKSESVATVDFAGTPLYLPYKALVSTISSMMFSEREAHSLIEMLSEKAGIIQGTWHMATQKGDPMTMLKKQLEEKEKQLGAEQEDSSAAKNRLRELTKELAAEKSKVASVETRLSSQLSKREQEMIALQARMQASYQDHVAQSQKLNAKIVSLKDQLEKGPNAQLARLQQENSILRDALNQATSQAESKQNAELAKLRQECAKLTKELGEKTEILHADEHVRKGLEAKVSAAEKQLSSLQANHAESQQGLQRKLEEVCAELRTTQSANSRLQDSWKKAQKDTSTLSEFQVKMGNLEAQVKERAAQVDALTAQLEGAQVEKQQFVQQLASINSLLEASQNERVNPAELQQLKLSLQEKDVQFNTLQEKLKQFQMKKEAAENTISELQQKHERENASLITSHQDELKNLKEIVQQSDVSSEQTKSSLTEKEALVTSLQDQLKESKQNEAFMIQLKAFESEAKESLQKLFPFVPLETQQPNWLQGFTLKAQEVLSQQSQSSQESPESLEKLKEAEETHTTLQAECEQYRTVLAETEGMLKHLQKSVEEEELVWRSKMMSSEEQLKAALEEVHRLESENQSIKQLKEQMMLLEAQLEKQSDNHCIAEELEQLRLQLSYSQSQLDLAHKEAQAHKEELAKVREPLSQVTLSSQQEQNGPTQAQPSQVLSDLNQTTEKLQGEAAKRQKLAEEFQQAQTTITELQAQLDLLKDSTESQQGDSEDVAQLKERLEKEKKLSKDLGQAATKLQQLLKAAQEQLSKERETVVTLQEHRDGKGEYVELKEGTSV
ncbi:ribosome-binding protein 1a [Phycodurus eques]|uniref:ribosome-binding protein 1a n=1 Tax=Phycodurus eques TaxID=693459 RepID=UPI002ACD7D31|nr:ribosome-binding protein 1a [Phycodurus eques]